MSNLALDRIENIFHSDCKYEENQSTDFKEFFEDMIGVSIQHEQQPEKVILRVADTLWPYIQTKPLHGSQKLLSKAGGFHIIELNLIVNYELTALLFSMGEELKVLEPTALSDRIKNKALAMVQNYS